jgi:hypothetical protein
MITEQDLHEYNKWLMGVWNPNQLYIPFAIDAPKAFLDHRSKVKNLSSNTVLAPGWIPIEQLPTGSMKVKWLCEDGVEDVGFYYSEQKEFASLNLFSEKPITHWKPL